MVGKVTVKMTVMTMSDGSSINLLCKSCTHALFSMFVCLWYGTLRTVRMSLELA